MRYKAINEDGQRKLDNAHYLAKLYRNERFPKLNKILALVNLQKEEHIIKPRGLPFWRKCPLCRKKLEKEGLEFEELYSPWFYAYRFYCRECSYEWGVAHDIVPVLADGL